jgi:hypothetical protein
MDHPAALVWMAWDRDTDTMYVYDCWKAKDKILAVVADAIKSKGQWIPVSWPHDGMQRDRVGGRAFHKLYRDRGCNMLRLSARYEDEKGGSQATEPFVMDVLDRMKTGRFRVFSHLAEWFEEKRMYHRKDGKIVAVKDDLMSATKYAVIMKRKARVDRPITMAKPRYQRAVVGGRR